uniref:Uncharacterized protein n=1 Tax=Fagus sylvatica TaxID=28930 RepID=A0A2N9GKX0_FAGSY
MEISNLRYKQSVPLSFFSSKVRPPPRTVFHGDLKVENTLAVKGENHYRPAALGDMRNHLATALPCLAVSSRSSNMRHRWMASISIAVRGKEPP